MSKETVAASAPVHQLVGRLRELLAKAAPGPWIAEGSSFRSTTSHPTDEIVDYVYDLADAQFIVAAINALPALLAIAEAAADVQDGVDKRDEDECEFAAAGTRGSAMEMHDRRMRLARALASLPNSTDQRIHAVPTLLDGVNDGGAI